MSPSAANAGLVWYVELPYFAVNDFADPHPDVPSSWPLLALPTVPYPPHLHPSSPPLDSPIVARCRRFVGLAENIPLYAVVGAALGLATYVPLRKTFNDSDIS